MEAGGQGGGGDFGDVVAAGGEDGGGEQADVPGGGGGLGGEVLPVGLFEDLGLDGGEHGGGLAAVADGQDSAPGEPGVERVQEAVVEESQLDAEAVRGLGHVAQTVGLGAGLVVGWAVGEGGQAGGALGADSFGEIEGSAPGGVKAAGCGLDRAGRIEADEYGGGHSTGLLCGVMSGGHGRLLPTSGDPTGVEAASAEAWEVDVLQHRGAGGDGEEGAGSMPERQHKQIVFAVTGGNIDLLA